MYLVLVLQRTNTTTTCNGILQMYHNFFHLLFYNCTLRTSYSGTVQCVPVPALLRSIPVIKIIPRNSIQRNYLRTIRTYIVMDDYFFIFFSWLETNWMIS